MLTCQIISQQAKVVYDNLESVTLPAVSGKMQILHQHAESYILLKPGNVKLKKKNGDEKNIQLNEGVCYLYANTLTILT